MQRVSDGLPRWKGTHSQRRINMDSQGFAHGPDEPFWSLWCMNFNFLWIFIRWRKLLRNVFIRFSGKIERLIVWIIQYNSWYDSFQISKREPCSVLVKVLHVLKAFLKIRFEFTINLDWKGMIRNNLE